MDRRTFIATTAATALPVSGIGPALALPAFVAPTSGAEDPLVKLFTIWLGARSEWARLAEIHGDWDTPEMLALNDTYFAATHEMTETSAVTLQGLKCQIILLWEEYGAGITGTNEAERVDPDLRLKRQILMGVENLTNAATWQPINPKMVPASQF